jgi:hypothetical protein
MRVQPDGSTGVQLSLTESLDDRQHGEALLVEIVPQPIPLADSCFAHPMTLGQTTSPPRGDAPLLLSSKLATHTSASGLSPSTLRLPSAGPLYVAEIAS